MRNKMFVFSRTVIDSIENLLVVKIHHDDTVENVFDAFKSGITDWLNNTSSGKSAYLDSMRDFNIGDLFSHIYDTNLWSCMGKHGIHACEVIAELTSENHHRYDEHLNKTPEGNKPNI